MFNIHPVRTSRELDDVHRLVYEVYLRQGYCAPDRSGRLTHYPHLDAAPETTVLAAYEGSRLLGTNSLTLDGPAGLHTDVDFPKECARIRAEGRRLAASWRIVTRPECRDSKRVVCALIQATVDLGFVRRGVQTCLFTFNPRHERVYRRLLNMRTLARRETTTGLLNAPAVLMRLDRESCPERWLDGGAPDMRKMR